MLTDCRSGKRRRGAAQCSIASPETRPASPTLPPQGLTANGSAAPSLQPPPLGTFSHSQSTRPATGHAAAPDDERGSVIGNDLSIEGQSITIRCRGSLRINGSIQAELHGKALVVGEEGSVQGTIAADQVDVWGKVSGAIMGARVTLHAGSEVEGDIHAKSLSIEEGANFDGRSRRVTDVTSIAPKLGPDAAPTASVEPILLPPGATAAQF